MRVVSFKVDEILLEQLEEYARRKRVTKSELIRRAIREYLREIEERPYIGPRVRVY